MGTPSAEALLTPEDVAQRLSCTRRHVMELHRGRRLPGIKIGKAVRFEPAAVTAFIAEARR